jgi:hypothetical protein
VVGGHLTNGLLAFVLGQNYSSHTYYWNLWLFPDFGTGVGTIPRSIMTVQGKHRPRKAWPCTRWLVEGGSRRSIPCRSIRPRLEERHGTRRHGWRKSDQEDVGSWPTQRGEPRSGRLDPD